jgi:hypothetical protein
MCSKTSLNLSQGGFYQLIRLSKTKFNYEKPKFYQVIYYFCHMFNKGKHLIILFVLSCFALIQKVQAQFYVSENTPIHLGIDITSQTELHIIDHSVSGQGQIIFKSTQKQSLFSSKDDIKLSGLSLQHTSLEINSSFIIDGNLALDHAVLQLNQPIFLRGRILAHPASQILGLKFINISFDIKNNSFPISSQQQIQHFILDKQVTPSTLPEVCLTLNKKPNFKTIESFKYTTDLTTPSPPPKLS